MGMEAHGSTGYTDKLQKKQKRSLS